MEKEFILHITSEARLALSSDTCSKTQIVCGILPRWLHAGWYLSEPGLSDAVIFKV